MTDEWTDQLFEASVDGMVVQLLDFDDDISRSQTVHELVNRNGGFVADDGQVARRSSWQLIFAEGIGDRGPDDTHLNRLQDFVRLLDGKARTVVHPVSGAFFAKPSAVRFSASGGQRAVVTVSVDWVEHQPDPVAFEVGSRQSTREAVDQVALTSAEVDVALADAGLESSAAADALATVQAWEDAASNRRRDITMQVNRLAAQLDAEATRLALAADVASSPIVLAFSRLQSNVANAGARFLAIAPQLEKWIVPRAMPLYAIVQSLYGSDDAEERYKQLLEQNTISDPLRIPEGAVLTIERP